MSDRYTIVAPYSLILKLKDFVVDNMCRNAIEGHSSTHKRDLGNLLPQKNSWEYPQ